MPCEYNFPPEDGHVNAQTCRGNNVTNIWLINKENCALKLVDEINQNVRGVLKSEHYILQTWRKGVLVLNTCILQTYMAIS